ncbi:MAG: L,D-transpeptidase, partial [Anaerolineales bacterium]|nr:L,D-transpeptidase [Anaerolineales bacterium]
VYATLDDALKRTGNFGYLRTAPAYVSVVGEAEREGRKFYAVYYGWMEVGEVQLISPSTFRGVLLTRPVDFRFGWVLTEMQSTNRLGEPVHTYRRYDVVHEVSVAEPRPGWFAVGPDEWLPEEALAITRAAVPEDAKACRFLYVDLAEQTLRVYHECRLVFATLVSTGREKGWTFPGRFAILQKFPYIHLSPPAGSLSVYYLEGVPHFMSYSGDWGFHAAYWHDEFGTPVSHGCVNLSPADARWLYEWAQIGERVIISAEEEP